MTCCLCSEVIDAHMSMEGIFLSWQNKHTAAITESKQEPSNSSQAQPEAGQTFLCATALKARSKDYASVSAERFAASKCNCRRTCIQRKRNQQRKAEKQSHALPGNHDEPYKSASQRRIDISARTVWPKSSASNARSRGGAGESWKPGTIRAES